MPMSSIQTIGGFQSVGTLVSYFSSRVQKTNHGQLETGLAIKWGGTFTTR